MSIDLPPYFLLFKVCSKLELTLSPNPTNSRSQSSLSGRDSDSMDNEVTLSKMDVVLSFALEVSIYKTFLYSTN